MISTLRSQVGFAAAVAHALLRLSRLELIGGSGRTAGRYVRVSRLLRAPSFRRPPSSRRGEVLWEREAAGSGSLGAASSESAAGSVLLRGCVCVPAPPVSFYQYRVHVSRKSEVGSLYINSRQPYGSLSTSDFRLLPTSDFRFPTT